MPFVPVVPILSSALAYQGPMSASVIGQSSRLAPVRLPYVLRALNSCSWTRSEAPAQCTAEPPTDLTIHAGRLGKSCATRQEPDVVRMSFQASWVKLAHSSLMKSGISWRPPASRITTLMPFCASSLPSVPPPAPEPTMQTTVSSFRSNVALVASLCLRQPVDVVEAAVALVALFTRGHF